MIDFIFFSLGFFGVRVVVCKELIIFWLVFFMVIVKIGFSVGSCG